MTHGLGTRGGRGGGGRGGGELSIGFVCYGEGHCEHVCVSIGICHSRGKQQHNCFLSLVPLLVLAAWRAGAARVMQVLLFLC